jgi:hypothetical protein
MSLLTGLNITNIADRGALIRSVVAGGKSS